MLIKSPPFKPAVEVATVTMSSLITVVTFPVGFVAAAATLPEVTGVALAVNVTDWAGHNLRLDIPSYWAK